MNKEVQTVLIIGVMILVFGVGFVVGFLVKSNTAAGGYAPEMIATQHIQVETVQLSDAGRRVATGLVPACGSSEPLLVHNCAVANEMKRMIESFLKSGLSEQEARESLISMYGKRIVASEQGTGGNR